LQRQFGVDSESATEARFCAQRAAQLHDSLAHPDQPETA
jgi:hypothetical protein